MERREFLQLLAVRSAAGFIPFGLGACQTPTDNAPFVAINGIDVSDSVLAVSWWMFVEPIPLGDEDIYKLCEPGETKAKMFLQLKPSKWIQLYDRIQPISPTTAFIGLSIIEIRRMREIESEQNPTFLCNPSSTRCKWDNDGSYESVVESFRWRPVAPKVIA